MKVIKLIILVAITMALTITLSTKIIDKTHEEKSPLLTNSEPALHEKKSLPVKRASRFLAEKEKNPRAADHCNKDNEICYLLEGQNSTCCNNKCVDLGYDDKNCGACKNKCKFTKTCCRGECVDLAYDKRHCGECNHRCMPGGYCIYGMCDYA